MAADSKKVKKGNIFFAIKGNKFNGENFIEEAIKITPPEKEKLRDITLNMISKKSLSEASFYFSNYLAQKRSLRFKGLTNKKLSLKIPSQQSTPVSFSGGSAGTSTGY